MLSLLRTWVEESESRVAFVLTGNHEMEEWYFDNEQSRMAVRRALEPYRSVKRMYFQDQPFRSYDVDNALDVLIAFGSEDGDLPRRSFRLAHAVTTDFVEAHCKGLDDTHASDRSDQIATFLGHAW